MRTALLGAVESTAATLAALCEAGAPPVAVLGLRAELAHRHSTYVDMSALAATRGIPFIPVVSVNSEETVERLASLDLDWLLVVGWSQICGARVLALPREGAIGYHPAALPEMRGRAPIAWTILLDRAETAGSLFLMAAEPDCGAILKQRRFAVDARETAASLLAKHLAVLEGMWRELLPLGRRAGMKAEPQDESRASYCARRGPEDGLIDWTCSAAEIDRLVRAVAKPYPGAFTYVGECRVTIWGARPWSGARHYGAPGQIAATRDRELLVSCGGYEALGVTAWEADDPALVLRAGARFGSTRGGAC
jgi:methionyl-tRNA formyltransferase